MSKAYLPVLIGLILVALVGALVYSQNRVATPTSAKTGVLAN